MAKFIKYPSIDQFRNIVKQVKDTCKYHETALPVLTFTGTVKLHGTNAAICFNTETEELWVQSRNNVITPEEDNAGFANYIESNKTAITSLVINYCDKFNLNGIVSLFGEWCGGNIQKSIALSQLDKMFIIFGIKYNEEWLNIPKYLVDNEIRLFNIKQFPTININIDFSNPQESINLLTQLTEEVENECPVGKFFGVSGIGEGIVWESLYRNSVLRFKVKGEKHSISKVKKLVSIDPEKLKSITEFVEYAVTNNRLSQCIEQLFISPNKEPDIKEIGSVIKWVMQDIAKEETDVLIESNLIMKDITKLATNKIRNWFIQYLDKSM